MRVTILGGAGFAGAHLAVHLAHQGLAVQALDSLVRPGSEHNLARLAAAGVELVRGDVRCAEDWGAVRRHDPEAIVDCAAQPSAVAGYRNPRLDFTTNTFAVLRGLEYCRETGAGFLLFSTNKVYGQRAVEQVVGPVEQAEDRFGAASPISELCPLDGGDRSLYGCSKIAADLMVQEWSDAFGFPGICNRFSCLAGPWQWGKAEQGWVAWWVIAPRLSLPLPYYGWEGRQVRDVLAIEDACCLIEQQLADLHPGPAVFNVGGGTEYSLSLRECTRLCQKTTGCKVPIDEQGQPRRADFLWYVSDIARARARHGWTPTALSSPASLIDRIDRWVCSHLDVLGDLFPAERTAAASLLGMAEAAG